MTEETTSKQIQYPRKPKDDWKSVKIKKIDHERINYLRWVEGWSVKALSELYKVGQWCVYYHIDSNFQKKMLLYGYEKKKRNSLDPKWREHKNQLMNEWRKLAIRERPDFRIIIQILNQFFYSQ